MTWPFENDTRLSSRYAPLKAINSIKPPCSTSPANVPHLPLTVKLFSLPGGKPGMRQKNGWRLHLEKSPLTGSGLPPIWISLATTGKLKSCSWSSCKKEPRFHRQNQGSPINLGPP